MRKTVYRRQFMARAAALFALPLAWLPRARAQTEAQTAALDAMIANITGGAPLKSGRVRLEIPVLADNGNSVSLRVAVDSPMTPADHVKSIHLFAPKNPRPNLANFYFGPGAGRPQLSTRIRLSGSQSVLAIAALSDGSFWSASADVAVTVSACWDAS
jgi:sulfur-oxidizing protein SoxY